jgi:hypothetical protein
LFRPRENIEILDAAFRLYRLHLPKLFTLSFLSGLAPSVVLAVLGPRAATTHSFIYWAALCSYWARAWLVRAAYAEILLTDRLDSVKAWRRFLRCLPRLIPLSLGYLIGVGLSTLAFVLPGVLLGIRWFFYDQVVLVEENPKAFARSRDLTEGMRTRMGVLLSAAGAMSFFLSGGLALFGIVPFTSVAARIIEIVSSALMAPVYAGVETLAYADLRSRREGYDLVLRAEALGVDMTQAA